MMYEHMYLYHDDSYDELEYRLDDVKKEDVIAFLKAMEYYPAKYGSIEEFADAVTEPLDTSSDMELIQLIPDHDPDHDNILYSGVKLVYKDDYTYKSVPLTDEERTVVRNKYIEGMTKLSKGEYAKRRRAFLNTYPKVKRFYTSNGDLALICHLADVQRKCIHYVLRKREQLWDAYRKGKAEYIECYARMNQVNIEADSEIGYLYINALPMTYSADEYDKIGSDFAEEVSYISDDDTGEQDVIIEKVLYEYDEEIIYRYMEVLKENSSDVLKERLLEAAKNAEIEDIPLLEEIEILQRYRADYVSEDERQS